MNDKQKTKAELIEELQELRRSLKESRHRQKDHLFAGDAIRTLETNGYRGVFDVANEAIFVFDSDTGVILDASQKVCEMYGYTRDEMTKLNIGSKSAGVTPYTQEEGLARIRKAVTEGPQYFEWLAKDKSNRLFWVDVKLKAVSIAGRTVVLAVVSDITERKRVEQELHATRDYLRTVFNNVYDAIFIHDVSGKVVDVNDKLLEMYRVTREEAMNSYIIRDFSAPDNPVAQLPPIWNKVLSGENQFFEWKARRPGDGSIFDVEVFLTKVSLPDGYLILAAVRDITDRKRVEQELHATRDYLRTVFNNVYDAIFFHDANGKVLDVNDKMLEMYRVTREEAIQFDIIPDYSAGGHTFDNLLPVFKKVLSGENQFFEWKARRPKDGFVFDVEVFLTRVSLPYGDFILANVRDITERKAMEKQLMKEKEVFFSVMNDNPHGIALYDNDGRFVYFNPEFTAITGYSLEDVPTSRDWVRKTYPDPEYRAKVVDFWKSDRLAEGRGKDVEWRITCRNGDHKDVEFRVTYLGDKSLAVLTDTTARKRAEEELRAEKQKFQILSENSPMAQVMIGADDAINYVNPKFRELFGYDLPDVSNMKEWFTLAYPDPSYRRRATVKWEDDRKSLKPGEGRPYVRRVTCNDGSQKHINIIPVKLETGEIFITCEDITKSKEAKDKIRERNLELEVLNDIIASVSSSLHLPEIVDTLRTVFVEKLKIPAGGIFFYDELTNRLRMEMAWGVPDTMRDDFETFVLKGYGAGTITRGNEVTLVRDHTDYGRSGNLFLSKFLNKWQDHLCIPLFAKGEMQGIVFLIDKESAKLRNDQVAFYRTLGQQIGVATQNARLFDQVRQSHTQMKALSLRLVEVQEAERRYIARELHDEIGQELTGLKLALEMNILQSGGETTPGALEAKSAVNRLVTLVRELSLNLRPAMLDDLGLLPTLPWHFERFAKQTNIRVAFRHSGLNDRRFPMEVETTIYRIVQEALTNIARHAKVNDAVVRLWSDEKMIGVQIEDSGIGFDTGAVPEAGNTSGLHGMRERAVLLGGSFTIETQLGSGTRVTAELPIEYDGEQL